MHSLVLPLASGETLNKFLCFLYNEVITIHTSEICRGGAWLHEAFRVALDTVIIITSSYISVSF